MNIARPGVGIAGASLVAGSVAATPYDGLYRSSGDADCAKVGVEGGALRIQEGLFEGVGSECRMMRPVDVVDMDATLYTMECSAGDTRWTERAMLMKAAQDNGLIMLWNGYAFRYARCDAETETEAETGATAGVEEPVTEGEGATGLPPPRVVLPWVDLPRIDLPRINLPAIELPPEAEPVENGPVEIGPAENKPASDPRPGPVEGDDSDDARGGTAAQVMGPDEAS